MLPTSVSCLRFTRKRELVGHLVEQALSQHPGPLTSAGFLIWVQGKAFQAAAGIGVICVNTLVLTPVIWGGTVVYLWKERRITLITNGSNKFSRRKPRDLQS